MSLQAINTVLKMQKTVEKTDKEEENDEFTKEGKVKSVTFKKAKDDGRKRFHPARFLALPFSHPRKWYKKVPKKRSPFIKNKAMDYTGTLNAVSDIALKRLHNRCRAWELKLFFAGNLNIASKRTEIRKVVDGRIETSFDQSWTDPSSVGQVQEAIINFACALQMVWPQDATALIMLRILIKFKWLVAAEDSKRASIITKFFNNVCSQNANRACNRECPISFREQEETLKSILAMNNIRPEVPLDNFAQRPTGSNKAQGKAGSQVNSKSSKTAKSKDGKPVCYAYNDATGNTCQNKQDGSGCRRADGLQLAHVCNLFDKSKKEYCLGAHPRKRHR